MSGLDVTICIEGVELMEEIKWGKRGKETKVFGKVKNIVLVIRMVGYISSIVMCMLQGNV